MSYQSVLIRSLSSLLLSSDNDVRSGAQSAQYNSSSTVISEPASPVGENEFAHLEPLVTASAQDIEAMASRRDEDSESEKALDAKLLAKIFKVDPQDILETASCLFLHASLLPAKLLLTPSKLCIFASLARATEQISNEDEMCDFLKVSSKGSSWEKQWVVLSNEWLSGHHNAKPKYRFDVLFRVPLDCIAAVEDHDGNPLALRVFVKTAEHFKGGDVLLSAESREQQQAWLLALRVAAAAAQQKTVQLTVDLKDVTSLTSPSSDVFGDSILSMVLSSGQRVFLSRVAQHKSVYKALARSWKACINAPLDTNQLAAVSFDHPEQSEFQSLFKLDGEPLIKVYAVWIATASYVHAAGRLYLSENYVCAHFHTWAKKLLLILPWTAISEIRDTRSLLVLDNGVHLCTDDKQSIKLLFSNEEATEVRDNLRQLWSLARARATDSDAAKLLRATSDFGRGADALALSGDDTDESGSDSQRSVGHEGRLLAPQFHTARNSAFHRAFPSVPIDQHLRDTYSCSLVTGDRAYSGRLHIVENFVCFQGDYAMQTVIANETIESATVNADEKVVSLTCRSSLSESDEHVIEFGNASRFKELCDVLCAIAAAPHGTKCAAPSAAASAPQVEFYHQQNGDFRKLFAVEADNLIATFSCSLRHNPLRGDQGTIYICRRFVGFASANRKLILPFVEITSVTRKTHSFPFSNGVVIATPDKTVELNAFKSGVSRVLALLNKLRARATRNARVDNPEYRSSVTVATEQLVNAVDQIDPLGTFQSPKPMTILLLTIGSRGDVQPVIAFAKALQADGHRAVIATHAEFEPFVRKHGVEHRVLAGDSKALMELCVENGMFTPKFIKEALATFRSFIDVLLRSAWDVCQDADVIVQAPSVMAGYHVAEKLGVPLLNYFTMPFTKTREFPSPFALTNVPLGGAFNVSSFQVIDQALFQPLASQINAFRGEIGLPPIGRMHGAALPSSVPFIYCFSRFLVPKPADWGAQICISGFWFLPSEPPKSPTDDASTASGQQPSNESSSSDSSHSKRHHHGSSRHHHHHHRSKHGDRHHSDRHQSDRHHSDDNDRKLERDTSDDDAEPESESARESESSSRSASVVGSQRQHDGKHEAVPEDANLDDLKAFIAAGDKPIYVGFGSISGIPDADAFIKNVLDGIVKSEKRCVLLSGWANVGAGHELPSSIYSVKSVPHDWLFPQMAAVVHHGGAGTLAAGLMAACPTIVVAFFGDQFFWGSRVKTMGVGQSFEAKSLKADSLATAIQQVTSDPQMKKRAEHIGQQIANENGVARAVSFLYSKVKQRNAITPERVLELSKEVDSRSSSRDSPGPPCPQPVVSAKAQK